MRAGEERVFDLNGVDREQYIAVNAQLGLDPESEAATAGVPPLPLGRREAGNWGLRGCETSPFAPGA